MENRVVINWKKKKPQKTKPAVDILILPKKKLELRGMVVFPPLGSISTHCFEQTQET